MTEPSAAEARPTRWQSFKGRIEKEAKFLAALIGVLTIFGGGLKIYLNLRDQFLALEKSAAKIETDLRRDELRLTELENSSTRLRGCLEQSFAALEALSGKADSTIAPQSLREIVFRARCDCYGGTVHYANMRCEGATDAPSGFDTLFSVTPPAR